MQIATALAYISTKISILLLLLITMFCVVFIYRCLLELFKRIKPSNWLLMISDAAVYIKFRSYLYEHYPQDDKQVIKYDASEIKAFRQTRIRDIICVGRSRSRQQSFYLDIIASGGLAMLQEALADEHSKYGLAKHRKSKIEISRLDFPVIVSQENIVQVDITRISPHNRKSLIAKLRNLGIEERDACNKAFDFTKLKSTDDDTRHRIVELLKSGRRLDARNVIEHVFQITRKQTHDMIEKLVQEHVLK